MAIAFRAVGTTSKVASGNMAPGLPAGHVADDILILFTNQADTVSCSVTSWTNITALTGNFGAGNLNRQEVWAKRDNGAESAPTVTHASGSVSNAIIAAFSGVDPGLSLTVGAGGIFRDAQKQTGTNATTFTAPALTGVISGDMRIFLGQFTVADTSGATTNNWGTVSGWTEDKDDCSSLGGANAASFGIDHLLATGSAASVTSAVGWTGSTVSTTPQFWAWQCSQLALSSDASAGGAVITSGSAKIATGFVGPQVLRYNFHRVAPFNGDLAPTTITDPPVPTVRIANRNVGPMVLRRNFHQPNVIGDVVAPSAAAPVVVTPGTASLTITSAGIPTVLTPRLVTPGKATLTITGNAPKVGLGYIPGKASLSLTAFTATVSTPRLVTPGKAALTLTASAPAVTVGIRAVPGVATLTLTARTPTVLAPRLVTPGTASLTLTRFAPSAPVGKTVTPGTASLTLTALPPASNGPSGDITITGGRRAGLRVNGGMSIR